MEDTLPPGSRGSYAHLICSACRARKIKCRLPRPQEEVTPSNSPRPVDEACERCRRLDLPCIVTGHKSRRSAVARRQRETPRSGADAPASPCARTPAVVNPRLFDQYYTPSDRAITATTRPDNASQPSPDAFEALRAMLTSANLMSTLLAQDSGFGASISSARSPGNVSITETISNGVATLLDESLVWYRFYLPFLPTLTELRSQLVNGSSVSSSTRLLFALLSSCALETPSSELYWHRELRRILRTFISYYGQQFLYDPPVHRHTVYILHVVISYRPTALIACQQSASAAIRGGTHIMLAYSIAEKCRFGSAANNLSNIVDASDVVSEDGLTRKALDALLWCRTIIHHILLEGSVLKPLPELESQLKMIDNALSIVYAAVLKTAFPAAVIYLFHAVRCVFVEMQHYVRMRRSRRDLAVLGSIIEAHEETSARDKAEILQILSARRSLGATEEEFTVALVLVPMDCNQSRTRLLGVAAFFAIMAHVAPSESSDKIRPHEAARVSKLVFNILRDPSGQGLWTFFDRYKTLSDEIVKSVLEEFIHASKNLKLHRMPWLPPARKSSQEILFQSWLIVDQNIARLDEGVPAHPHVKESIVLIEQCAESLESLSVPVDRSVDDAFGDGCHYAASAKLLRCLHSILSMRTRSEAVSTTSSTLANAQSPAENARNAEASLSNTETLDFEQVFGEWANWPYNSTWNMAQSLQDSMPD